MAEDSRRDAVAARVRGQRGSNGEERSENDDSISLGGTARAARRAPPARRERTRIAARRHARGDQRVAQALGGRAARAGQRRDVPAIDARPHRVRSTPSDVLVGEHPEHRERLRGSSPCAERIGQRVRGVRIVRDVEHDRPGAPAAPGSGPASATPPAVRRARRRRSPGQRGRAGGRGRRAPSRRSRAGTRRAMPAPAGRTARRADRGSATAVPRST